MLESRPLRLRASLLLALVVTTACSKTEQRTVPAPVQAQPAAQATPPAASPAETAAQAAEAAQKAAAAAAAEAAQATKAAASAAVRAGQAQAPSGGAADPHAAHAHDTPAPGVDIQGGVDPNSKARLTCEFGTDTKNFGKAMQGDVLTHTFELRSSGEEELVIKQAKPTCGCTVAQILVEQPDGSFAPYPAMGSPIPAGRKVRLAATLHTQGKRGQVSSTINVYSNDPRGQTPLSLTADVDPFFLVAPLALNFNTLSSRDTATDRVTISTTRGERVRLTTSLDNLPAGMKLDLQPMEPDAEGKSSRWQLQATLGPGLVEGQLAHSASLKSDLPIPGADKGHTGHVPTYEAAVTIMGRITGAVSYNPGFVSLGLIRPGQVVARSVRVTSHDPAFRLDDVRATVEGREGGTWEFGERFSTLVRPVAGENAVEVEVRLDGMPDTLNGSFNGTFVIHIGHPEKPEVRLPITGVCRGTPQPAAPASGPR